MEDGRPTHHRSADPRDGGHAQRREARGRVGAKYRAERRDQGYGSGRSDGVGACPAIAFVSRESPTVVPGWRRGVAVAGKVQDDGSPS